MPVLQDSYHSHFDVQRDNRLVPNIIFYKEFVKRSVQHTVYESCVFKLHCSVSLFIFLCSFARMPCCRAAVCVSCDVEVGFTDTNCPCCSALISRGMVAMQGQTVSWEAIEANRQANDDLRLVMILEQSD